MADARAELGRILASIAGSTLELGPILGEIAAEARRLCEADGAFSFIRHGERLHQLSDVAEGGQILISQRHFAAVEDRVAAAERPPITQKCFGRPVPVWAVETVRGES